VDPITRPFDAAANIFLAQSFAFGQSMGMAYRKRALVGPYPSRAQVTFGRILEERDTSQAKAAAELGGVSTPAVSEWRSAWSRPNDENRRRVAEWSRDRDALGNPVGAPRIPVEDWDVPPAAPAQADEAA
jgi:hypothetical protein